MTSGYRTVKVLVCIGVYRLIYGYANLPVDVLLINCLGYELHLSVAFKYSFSVITKKLYQLKREIHA
jgi:hypothetical protein